MLHRYCNREFGQAPPSICVQVSCIVKILTRYCIMGKV